MIKTILTIEDALAIMELGKGLHSESHYKDEPFEDDKCWRLLESTISHPTKRFIAFDSEYRGFLILGLSEHFFNHTLSASDQGLYIKPEARGGSLVIRLLQAGQEWAQANGASDITIYHNTSINTDKAPKLFNKLGFDMKGYIFSKELDNV